MHMPKRKPRKHMPSVEEECSSKRGFYYHQTETCVHYYWIHEVCISIAKKDDGDWYLDDNRYYQNSYGCAYRLNNRFTELEYEEEINNL